jgi:hypothetical protein|tara:strand:- start:1210 stop:1449 length:240 start_codon:yes stop_codon:yes gene_type:complete
MVDVEVYGYDDNGINVEWYWSDQVKKNWKTWKPKVEDVLLVDLTHTQRNGKIIYEIFQDVMDKEHPKKIKPTGIYKVRR